MTDTRLIHNVGAGALEWLWAHRDGFQLEPDVDPEVGFLERFKPIGELAMICKVLFRGGRGIAPGTAGPATPRPRLARDAGRRPHAGARAAHGADLPIPFEVYLPFKELGYSQPEVERAAALNHRLDSWVSFEATPTRRLGLSAFQRRFGLPPRPAEAELRDTTWLARTPSPGRWKGTSPTTSRTTCST
ncbi:hypothetical protein SPURM210S_08227 [Streptomyces purpurascens]